LLSSIAIAMGRRRKAIGHKSKGITMEREADSDGYERLNIKVRTTSARPARLTLSVWSDGLMWFSGAQSGPSRRGGWRFMLTFHGDVGSLTPEEVANTFEASLGCVYGDEVDPDQATARLLAVWKHAGPEIERDDNAREL